MYVAYTSCRAWLKPVSWLATARLGRPDGGLVLDCDLNPVLNM
jgi:hypothetical protein